MCVVVFVARLGGLFESKISVGGRRQQQQRQNVVLQRQLLVENAAESFCIIR
jgi:hypothetical protein